MRQVLRVLVGFPSMGSAIVCLFVAAAWVRSYFVSDVFQWSMTTGDVIGCESFAGRISIVWIRVIDRSIYDNRDHQLGTEPPVTGFQHRRDTPRPDPGPWDWRPPEKDVLLPGFKYLAGRQLWVYARQAIVQRGTSRPEPQ